MLARLTFEDLNVAKAKNFLFISPLSSITHRAAPVMIYIIADFDMTADGTWLAIYERTFAPAHNKATLSVETATLYIHESLYRVVHSLDDKGRALALLYGASR